MHTYCSNAIAQVPISKNSEHIGHKIHLQQKNNKGKVSM